MASYGCGAGFDGVPKPGAPFSFNITTGFYCGLYGATGIFCKLLDQTLPSLIPGFTLTNLVGRRIKLTRQIISLLPDKDIPTKEFCNNFQYPSLIDASDFDVYRWVFLALAGQSDELIEWLGAIAQFRSYFQYCECRRIGKTPIVDPTPPFQPPQPIPAPDIDCLECGVAATTFLNAQAAGSWQFFQFLTNADFVIYDSFDSSGTVGSVPCTDGRFEFGALTTYRLVPRGFTGVLAPGEFYLVDRAQAAYTTGWNALIYCDKENPESPTPAPPDAPIPEPLPPEDLIDLFCEDCPAVDTITLTGQIFDTCGGKINISNEIKITGETSAVPTPSPGGVN